MLALKILTDVIVCYVFGAYNTTKKEGNPKVTLVYISIS